MLISQNATRFRIMIFKLGYIFLTILFFHSNISAKNVNSYDFTLEWDYPEEFKSQITGYKIFFRKTGEEYNETNMQEIYNPNNTTYTITILDDDPTYCFSVTAFAAESGNESPKSNEDCYDPNLDIQTNSPPVAVNEDITSIEDTPKSITLTASDSDLDPLTYMILNQPSHGTLSGAVPNITYTPDTNYSGIDSFGFKVNDGTADSNTATVNIIIYPLASCRILEDAEDGKTDRWSIYDRDPLGASISNVFDNDRQNRVIELSSVFRDFCYLFQNADGSKWNNSIQFLTKWSMRSSNYFIVYIEVNTTAGNKYLYYTPVDLDILGSLAYIHHGLGSDVIDGKWHSFERDLQADLEEAQSGVSILDVNGFMIYGSGRIDDISLCDTLSADTDDISLNSLPIANDQSLIISEDTPKSITLTSSDSDLDPLTYTILDQPSHGTLSGTAPNLIYSPTTNYNGADSFNFKANDGQGDSNIATVGITITPVNDPPVASAQAFTTKEDVAIYKSLSAVDVDGDGLTYSVETNGTKGNATITNPSTGAFTYTPYKNINGTDTFLFKVNDGSTDSLTAKITINITPANAPPVASTQYLNTDENTALNIILKGSDEDGNILTYTIVTQTSHGTLSGAAPNITYTPDTNYSGIDSFSFKVNDGIADSNTATVNIIIYPLASCRIYEDAEDYKTDRWIIYDRDPLSASISNVFDNDRQNRVIELSSVFRDFCYLFQNADGSKLNNSTQFLAKWSMRSSNYFIVYIEVNTTAGNKYLYYTPVDIDILGSLAYIHRGLGSDVIDGKWHSFERDLQADLEEAQPGVSILEVNGFMIYGSGRIDDISLCDTNKN